MTLIFRKVDWKHLSNDEAQFLLDCANDMVNQKVITNKPISSFNHNIWLLNRKLDKVSSDCWILESDKRDVGFVRIDKKHDNEWHVDVYIVPWRRGANIGFMAIEYALYYWGDHYPNSLFIAEVKADNVPSQHLFESHNPDFISRTSGIIYYIWNNGEELLRSWDRKTVVDYSMEC